MYICIQIPKEKTTLIEQAKLIPDVKVKEIQPLGATEFIAIFIPIVAAIITATPDTIRLVREILSDKEVVVNVNGRTMHGKPQEIIDSIKEMPEVIEYLKNNGELTFVNGGAKEEAKLSKLLNKEKESGFLEQDS